MSDVAAAYARRCLQRGLTRCVFGAHPTLAFGGI
jgi:hypothetical protein